MRSRNKIEKNWTCPTPHLCKPQQRERIGFRICIYLLTLVIYSWFVIGIHKETKRVERYTELRNKEVIADKARIDMAKRIKDSGFDRATPSFRHHINHKLWRHNNVRFGFETMDYYQQEVKPSTSR